MGDRDYNEVDSPPVSVHPATTRQMSNLQKYMRAEKETLDCISESILFREERSIPLEAK